ncbi:MAG: mechanosensitive ion channel family protein [Planctomycetota bacterium]|nr:MAG: mechanosensitive ion channel family protein [Planctomycetota bacterium]
MVGFPLLAQQARRLMNPDLPPASALEEVPVAAEAALPAVATELPPVASASAVAKSAEAQISAWYDAVYQFVTTQGLALLFKLIAAAAIFYFGRMLARMATKIVSEVLEKLGTDPILVKFGANLLYCSMLVMIAIASLNMVGVDVTSVTAMIAAAGFAVGLALQGSLANFAAGIMLIIFKPFGVGDEIEAGGETGNVEEVNIFNTILRTNGNVKIIIPNGQITIGTIKNFTAQRIRLIELKVGCGYCDDLNAVKSFLERVLVEDRRVVQTPPPSVAVIELADFSVVFSVKCWVGTKEFATLRSALLERIKVGFDEEGYTFPYPSRDIYVHQSTTNINKVA